MTTYEERVVIREWKKNAGQVTALIRGNIQKINLLRAIGQPFLDERNKLRANLDAGAALLGRAISSKVPNLTVRDFKNVLVGGYKLMSWAVPPEVRSARGYIPAFDEAVAQDVPAREGYRVGLDATQPRTGGAPGPGAAMIADPAAAQGLSLLMTGGQETRPITKQRAIAMLPPKARDLRNVLQVQGEILNFELSKSPPNIRGAKLYAKNVKKAITGSTMSFGKGKGLDVAPRPSNIKPAAWQEFVASWKYALGVQRRAIELGVYAEETPVGVGTSSKSVRQSVKELLIQLRGKTASGDVGALEELLSRPEAQLVAKPAGVDRLTWRKFERAVTRAREAVAASVGVPTVDLMIGPGQLIPEGVPTEVAQPLIDAAQRGAVAPVVPAEVLPSEPLPSEPGAPGVIEKITASMREHPVPWILGAGAAGVGVWQIVKRLR